MFDGNQHMSAGFDGLYRQSKDVADDCFARGMSLAQESNVPKPERTAVAIAYMQAAMAHDVGTTTAVKLQEIGEALSALASCLPEALRGDHPLQGETLDGVSDALSGIAIAIKDGSR